MAYYDALTTKWATLTGTTQQKLDAINALTVPGPTQNVTVSTVVGNLILGGAYLSLVSFSQTATNNNVTHDTALLYAKTLVALIQSPNAPDFATGTASSYALIKGMMDAILAQELAVPGSTGFTQAVHDNLLSLAATTIPWWHANGYTSPFAQPDLIAAGGLT